MDEPFTIPVLHQKLKKYVFLYIYIYYDDVADEADLVLVMLNIIFVT